LLRTRVSGVEKNGFILVFAMVCGVCNRGRDLSVATPIFGTSSI